VAAIKFFVEQIDFSLKAKRNLHTWLLGVALSEKHQVSALNYIFCSDEYLLDINKQYLNHNYYTDVITFDNSDDDNEEIEGDIFISIDRVKDNALENKSTFARELHRVMVHGLLHLLGYRDKSEEEILEMREKEEAYLSLQKF
jgi:probable rRNA maturation factor